MAAAWGEKDPCPLYRQGVFLLGAVVLSSRDGHSLLSQYVADAALGDGLLELGFEEGSQFPLSEGQVLSFLLLQPGPSLSGHLVRVTVAVVNERFPGGTSLAVATTKLGKIVSAQRKAQFLAEVLKALSSIKALEKLLLGQSSFDLTGGVALHKVPPEAEMAP